MVAVARATENTAGAGADATAEADGDRDVEPAGTPAGAELHAASARSSVASVLRIERGGVACGEEVVGLE